MANVKQTQKMIPFVTCEITRLRVGFWSIYLIWILGSKLILLNNQSSATLWVLDTCLIVGHFCPRWSFWSLPRYLQGCTTETRIEENVGLWWRSPHVTTDQHHGFPFVWILICDFAISFLLLHGLVIRYSSINVTLLSPRPINQQQKAHPSLNQPPTK